MVPVTASGALLFRIAVIALTLSASASSADGQERAYLPLDDAAYDYVDALIARGALGSLPALERPYTIERIRAALDSSERDGRLTAHAASAKMLRRLLDRRAVNAGSAARDGEVAVTGSVTPFLTASSTGVRELMRADDESGLYPGLSMRLAIEGGPITAVSRVISDHRYKDDPEYTGKVDRAVAGRVEDAYVAGHWRYGSFAFGRVARNWGPARLHGLQLGHYAYSHDHVHARLGTDRLQLTSVLTRLDDIPDSTGTPATRYLALHRFGLRWRSLEVALTEAMLYGGAGRQLQLSYANPLNIFQLSQYNEGTNGNMSLGLDASLRTASGTFAAQLLVDDIQVDRCDPNCREPSSWGASAVAEGLPLTAAHRWFLSYTRVSNLAYRTPKPFERYTSEGIGIGRGFSDYDELRVGLDLTALGGSPLRAYAAWSRQGEGDYRRPFPSAAEYGQTAAFLDGTVQRVGRLGVSGAAVIGWLELRGDLGYNVRHNAGFVAGARDGSVEGWIRLSVDPPFAVGFRP